MAINDCGICELLACGASIPTLDAPIVIARLLCDVATRIETIETVQAAQAVQQTNASSGYATKVTENLTVDTNPYAINDSIGGLITFSWAFGPQCAGIVQNLILADKGYKNKQVMVYIFDSNPSLSTFTDQAPVVIHANDQNKLVSIYTITQFYALAASGYGIGQNLGIAVRSTSTTLFAALVAAEAVTYGAAGDLNLTLNII